MNQRSNHVQGDNHGVVIAGDGNVVYVSTAPASVGFEVAVKQLVRGLRAQARASLRAVMDVEPDNPDVYFVSAIAALEGKSAFRCSLDTVREAESLTMAAIGLHDRGIFHYFLAYLSYDYYERKCLRGPRPWQATLVAAWSRGVTEREIESLFTLLAVDDPLSVRP